MVSCRSIVLAVAGAAGLCAAQQAQGSPGYFVDFSTLPNNNTFSFGQHYAVLNLDLINGIVGSVSNTPEGKAFISSVVKWIDAVHSQRPAPLSIFTRIYSVNAKHPEIAGPFASVFSGFNPGTADDNATQIYPAFKPRENYDVVLAKTRYYAGTGNELEEILSAQEIDTVILSGVRTSGVILNTAYTLLNLNYNVFLITDNCIETPPNTPGIDRAIKQGIVPKLPGNVITLKQALAALARSGPAVY